MTVTGGATSTGITLQLAVGVTAFILAGAAPINVIDSAGVAAASPATPATTSSPSRAADAASGGAGTNDRLVVDYHSPPGP